MNKLAEIRRVFAVSILVLFTAASCQTVSNVRQYAERQRQLRKQAILAVPIVRDQEQASTAVVKIVASKENDKVETGSGIFLGNREGIVYILTAYHVVEGLGTTIKVEFYGFPGRVYDAELLRADESKDVAVISINYPVNDITERIVPFSTASPAQVGEMRKGKFGFLMPRNLGNPSAQGVLVSDVAPGSQAELATLKKGDRILSVNEQIVGTTDQLRDAFHRAPQNSEIKLIVDRSGEQKELRIRERDNAQDSGMVYTIGHPKDKEWLWNAGYIITNETTIGTLLISKDLGESGISGGPLFDDHYRVIGMVKREGDEWGEALNIEDVLKIVESWRVPFRFWLTSNFCEGLNKVIQSSWIRFEDLKQGAAKKDRVLSRWKWDAEIDLTGMKKSYIEKPESGDLFYSADFDGSIGNAEAEKLQREVAAGVMKCILDPDPDLSEDKYGIYITAFIKNEKNGKLERTLLNVYKFASLVELRVE